MLKNLHVVSFKPSETAGVVVVTLRTEILVEVNVVEDTVARIDDPQVAEAVREAAADRLTMEMFAPTANGIAKLRDSSAKKYHKDFNKLLENLISGGQNG
jgi:hypothetical protein